MIKGISTFKTNFVECKKINGKTRCNLRNEIANNSDIKLNIDKTKFIGDSFNVQMKEGNIYSFGGNMRCVSYHNKGTYEGKKDILYCRKMQKSDENKILWGFDLTKMKSQKEWENLLKKHKFKKQKVDKSKGYEKHIFKNNDNIVITTGDDSDGHLGYVGVDIPEKELPSWERIRKDFINKSSYIKEEEGGERGFI